jgi:hypothetical protein
MLWRHFPRAMDNTMKLRAVTEALNFLSERMVVNTQQTYIGAP